jgi:polar amino acid transport system permease protein
VGSYIWDFETVWKFREVFARGALTTTYLTFAAVGIGVALGLVLGLARNSKVKPLSLAAGAYIEFFRTTPALVQLVWIYYSLPIFTGIQIPNLASVAIGLGFHSAAYFAEIFRAGIQSIDRGQTFAARSLGMSHWQSMRRIILPQAVQRMVPPFINEFVTVAKLTTLGSVLAVYELMHEANNLIVSVHRPLEIYTALALMFFVILFPIVLFSQWLERRWARRQA